MADRIIQKEDKTALTIGKNREVFHFGTISIKRTANEVLYIFPFAQKRGLVKFIDYGKPTPEENIERTPDHISFHKDGKVHLRYKNAKGVGKTRNDIKFNRSPLALGDDHYAPLLFHTIYNADTKCLPPLNNQERYNRECAIGSKTGCVTVVLFAIGKNVAIENMLNVHFPDAFELQIEIGNLWERDANDKYVEEFQGTRLLLAISHKPIMKSADKLLFAFGITPPDKVIKSLGE